ncbi:MAG: CoA transferase [Pseudomonadales bacterium]|jgi:crotonobetainyl-CoA:carnitine CoA-transferase CaiB-like acyl-CoA transferase|nr:CoA transferase [Pseudomonadales bacterium]|tara:strand:- start:1258 stop:2664 length:1407 start_codon:yes stop_codon:yes gene_type:complete
MTRTEFARVIDAAGQRLPQSSITFFGGDPVFPSPMCLASGMGSALAMVGSAIDDIWGARTGRRQEIEIDLNHAALFMSSMWLLKVDGKAATTTDNLGPLPVEGLFHCADGKWISISCVFPALTNGTLEVLGCAPDHDSAVKAIARWKSFELEEALTEKDLSGVVVRSEDEWLNHPQGAATSDLPVVELECIGDAPVSQLPECERPLAGLRVLDLTRVLAGPTISRTLAQFGAEVLHISAPHLPDLNSSQIDTGHGKRRTHLNIDKKVDERRLWELVQGADVFSQSYRTGRLAQRGFAPERVAAAKPGIIYVSENCYGHVGPWLHKRGYDSNVRAVSGVLRVHEQPGDPIDPQRLHYAMHDYGTGCWGAYGVLQALKNRAKVGGSWHVKVSLNQTARWFMRLGTPFDPNDAPPQDELREMFANYSEINESSYGQLQRLKPVIQMSETAPAWQGPTLVPGESEPVWLGNF